MTASEEAGEVVAVASAVVPARSSPVRATMLAVGSRLVLAAAIGSGGWAGLTLLDMASGAGSTPPVPVMVRTAIDVPAGTTLSALLVEIDATLRGSAARLHELHVGAPEGVRAPVALRLELPSGSAGAVERIARGLEAAGLDDVATRSVTPVPDGARIDIAAHVLLAALGPIEEAERARPAAVVLTDAVARVGASLQHLEVPSEEGEPVLMEVRGDLRTLAALVADLEERHTAPLRFTSLGLRAAADHPFDARLVFRTSVQAPARGRQEAS